MARISKKKLTPELTGECLRLLCEKIVKIGTPTELERFLDIYFTPIEKNTILRRTAAIILLKNKTKYRDIENLLDISRATISKAKQISSGDGYGKNLKKRRQPSKEYVTPIPIKKKRKKTFRPYKGAESII
jgi:uncharacterized protein YerC